MTAVTDRKIIVLHILCQCLIPVFAQGCQNYSTIHWSVSGKNNMPQPQHSNINCLTVKDPRTYERHHEYPSRTVESLQGRIPKYSCHVEVNPNCRRENVTLLLGEASTCQRVPETLQRTTAFNFEILNEDNDTCTNGTLCKTIVQLDIETMKENFTLIVDKYADLSNIAYNFQGLDLVYQPCMNESLEFQIPMSADVPLIINCSLYNGGEILDEQCLLNEATTQSIKTTEATIPESEESTDESKERIDNNNATHPDEPSDKNLIYIIAGAAGGGLLLIIIIAVCCCVCRRKKKDALKSNNENSNIRSFTNNVYEEMPEDNTQNGISDSQQVPHAHTLTNEHNPALEAVENEREDFTSNYASVGSYSKEVQPSGMPNGNTKVEYSNEEVVNEKEDKSPKWVTRTEIRILAVPVWLKGDEELSLMYAKPCKLIPRTTDNNIQMVDNAVYDSSLTAQASVTASQSASRTETGRESVNFDAGEYCNIKETC